MGSPAHIPPILGPADDPRTTTRNLGQRSASRLGAGPLTADTAERCPMQAHLLVLTGRPAPVLCLSHSEPMPQVCDGDNKTMQGQIGCWARERVRRRRSHRVPQSRLNDDGRVRLLSPCSAPSHPLISSVSICRCPHLAILPSCATLLRWQEYKVLPPCADGAMPNRAATQYHQGRHDWSVHAASWQAGWPLATAQPPPPKEPRHRAGASVQELLSTSSRHSLSASHPAHPRSATPSCRLDLKYLASDTSPSTSRLPEPDTFPSAQHPSAPSAASLARRTKLTHRVKHHQNGGVLVAQGP